MQRPKGLPNARKLIRTHPRKAHGGAFYPLLQPPHFRQVISSPPFVIQHNLTSLNPYEPPILLSAHKQVFKDKAMGKVTETRSHSWEQKPEQVFIDVYTNAS